LALPHTEAGKNLSEYFLSPFLNLLFLSSLYNHVFNEFFMLTTAVILLPVIFQFTPVWILPLLLTKMTFKEGSRSTIAAATENITSLLLEQ
jgi:hypothetical protein